jgi:AraC-like DNA-binding protein
MPLTADPMGYNSRVFEILPERALRPYVRCFWTNVPNKENDRYKTEDKKEIVLIPDTCMDIIFKVDYRNNRVESSFCGINDKPGTTSNAWKDSHISVFAIRFYAWAVVLFSSDSMSDALNQLCEAEKYFPYLVQGIKSRLFEVKDFSKRIELAQELLLSRLNLLRINNVLNHAIHKIIASRGTIKLNAMAKSIYISERQLQRIFHENIGISPKKLADLIRYQFLWTELIINPTLDIQNAVMRYGYADQAHMLNVFKKYHTMTPRQAICYANNHVGFLQDKTEDNM